MNTNETLYDNQHEQLIYQTKPHWVIFLPTIFWFILLLFFLIFGSEAHSIGQLRILNSPPLYKLLSSLCLIIGTYYGISAYIRREFTEYVITTRRILVKTGLINKKTVEIMGKKIEGIHVFQTPSGRLLNYGSVVVVGIGGSQDPFPYVPNPELFRQKVQILGNIN